MPAIPPIETISDKLLSGLYESLIVLATGVVSYLGLKLKGRKLLPSVDALVASGEIISEIDSLVSTLNAGKGLLIFTSNGGGIPSAGKLTYVTILFECMHSNQLSQTRSFQGTACDTSYIKMLNTMLEEGCTHGKPDNLPNGILKDLFHAENVAYYAIFPVVQTKMRFYYLSLRWYEDTSVPDIETIRNACQGTTSTIASILKTQPNK